jgi:hypothetical protein
LSDFHDNATFDRQNLPSNQARDETKASSSLFERSGCNVMAVCLCKVAYRDGQEAKFNREKYANVD